MCNMKGAICSDNPTEDYHLTLQFPSAQRRILASFSPLLLSRFSLTALISIISSCSCSHCTSTKQQADKVEHLTARYLAQELVDTETELEGE